MGGGFGGIPVAVGLAHGARESRLRFHRRITRRTELLTIREKMIHLNR